MCVASWCPQSPLGRQHVMWQLANQGRLVKLLQQFIWLQFHLWIYQHEEDESLDVKKPLCAGSTVKQNRTGDVHNLSEEEEIYRINDGMKSLQQFIPNSSKTDKASMLDEVYEYTKYLRLRQMAMDARMRGVDMRATGSGQGLIPVTSPTSPAVPHSMSVPGTMMDLEIQQRCKVEQLGMVHQSSSKGISMIFCPSLPHVSLSVQLFCQSRKTFSSSKLQ
jgi:hypothetical protein